MKRKILNLSRGIMYILFCTISLSAFTQNIQVTGKVTDATGEAIIGANVTQKGTTIGTATDIDGNFSLNIPRNATLAVSYLGYISQEINVNNRSNINITLLEDVQTLNEVVVTGYGSQKKATLTGAISSVNSEQLTVTKNENVVNMLAGKIPGVRITQRSSQPGQYNSVIDVRGFGEPLFVIDGVARSKDDFVRMDPEEIESISLLKDASAAIYGIRAANGVMLITTKSGKAQGGKVDVTYSGNITFQEMMFIPDGYTEYQWKTLRNEQQYRDFNQMYFGTKPAIHSDEELTAALDAKEYNWQKEVFKKYTPQTQHNLSVNGGSESLRYFLSLGYLKQDGAYSSGSLWSDKINLRSNVDAKITDRLGLRVSIGGMIGNLWEPGAGLWDNYKAAFLAIPGTPFYANDNPEYLNGYTPWNNEFTNLLGKMDSDYVGYMHRRDRRANASFTLNYDIPWVDGLSASAFYDYSYNTPDTKTYHKMYNTYKYEEDTETYVLARLENGPNTTVSRGADYSLGHTMQLSLSYLKNFLDHNVDAKLIYEENYSEWDNFSAQRILKLNAQDLFAGESVDQVGSGGTPGDRSAVAFIGRVNYDYAGKYILTLLGRYEANSRWAANTRWGFFPSISAAWHIGEESFIKDNFDTMSTLKLRASYGKMGDEGNAGAYPEVFVGYRSNNNFGWIFSPNSGTTGLSATAIPNLQKTWIKVTSQNIGLDFGFFRNKIFGTLDFFRRDRDGLMATSTTVIPGTVGAVLPQVNINSDRYFGWEFELAYRDRIEDFNYSISGQISSTRRKWLFRQEEPASNSFDNWRNRYNGRYNQDDFWWSIESGSMFTSIDEIRNFTDYPIGQTTLPGDWSRVDWNGDGIVDGGDSRPMATKGLPYFNYGISLTANYKAFDLAAHFQGASKVYMQLSEVFTEALPFGGQNSMNWFWDRWHPVDPKADYWHPNTEWIPGYYPLTGGSGRRDDSNGIMNASYLRLKTLEIGYNLPKSLLARGKVEGVRIYLNAYNLLTLSALDRTIDPERPSSTAGANGSDTGYVGMYGYPNNKTYTLGVSFKF